MAVVDAHVFLGFLTPVITQLSFQSHRLLFSHASAEVKGENSTERKFALTGSRTHKHQVMNPTRLPLSNPGGARIQWKWNLPPYSFKRQKTKYCNLEVILERKYLRIDQTAQGQDRNAALFVQSDFDPHCPQMAV